ncbi:MAG TPA: isochorismatase family protein [Aliidongia sp.]|uniref:isochorismatase family protein n=1 Tax=Aliidongia sp. TaxID=1914230 RepID=UPI002DDD83BF|nr:isochorismatase family protein [Aliidongia sp.]HEV2677967.1 isochorismatase family protein [Aliidongia sp.]
MPALSLSSLLAAGLAAALVLQAPAARATTIIDEWASVPVPPPPVLAPATVDPKTTALLVLDIVRQGCNAERRPRCLATLPAIQAVLARARGAGMMVAYSLVKGSTPADVLREAAPLGTEPMVTAGTDKFLGTDLEAALSGKGIKTVIILGVAAQGAVMTTATEAALRGFEVVVPLDGVSSDSLYGEQYTAWDLMNAPAIAGHVVLSRTDLIGF